MIYGLIKLELDDFSGLDTRWVPDLDSLRCFTQRRDRDEVLSELDVGCESYEAWMPVDISPVTHEEYLKRTRRSKFDINYPREKNGRFKKYL